mgnify:CR=1 FL=1
MVGKVERYLLNRIRKDGAIHITLIDPEKTSSKTASRVAKEAESAGTAAIMMGGSTSISLPQLDRVIKAVKKVTEIPIILFPNNVTSISRYADAIWFMSLINSLDPYFITGAQVLGAPLVKKFGLEPIPLGYIIVGEGGTAAVIGRACPIPYNKPMLAAAHALAAQYLGMRFVYLEAGSGVKKPVPSEMIRAVKETVSIPIIVGGGIRSREQAKEAVDAGANIIVTGTITEESKNLRESMNELIKGVSLGKR